MESAELWGKRFPFVVSALIRCLIAWLVLEGRGERFLLRREGWGKWFLLRRKFSLAASIEFAFESVVSDCVDGVCFVFGVNKAGAVVNVVDFWRFNVVFETTVLIKVVIGRFCCFLG